MILSVEIKTDDQMIRLSLFAHVDSAVVRNANTHYVVRLFTQKRHGSRSWLGKAPMEIVGIAT